MRYVLSEGFGAPPTARRTQRLHVAAMVLLVLGVVSACPRRPLAGAGHAGSVVSSVSMHSIGRSIKSIAERQSEAAPRLTEVGFVNGVAVLMKVSCGRLQSTRVADVQLKYDVSSVVVVAGPSM